LLEESSIKSLFDNGVLVIASGGGGIPVTEDDNGNLYGLEAVVDKDYTASLLASIIEADILLVLTDVDNVAINYGKPHQRDLNHITIGIAREYHKKGYFPSGTMGPKIESSIHFLENGGKKAIITSLKNVPDALKGNAGTIITQ
jgi:carbamate kinase